jgi:hypothetical protein
MTPREPSVTAWLAAALACVACVLLPFTVNVTDVTPSGNAVVAVTVLAPGVDPRVRTVLDVAAAVVPVVGLGCGEKLSPGTLLVQLTVPQGAGITGADTAVQLIDTTRG